ncbi:MAG: hypothetical protein QOD94_107 [Alphaproteobacteria bacterium]|jgi:hypothetical protein|nr:hypothetical protein [Alphaproteobacteria bacterium]
MAGTPAGLCNARLGVSCCCGAVVSPTHLAPLFRWHPQRNGRRSPRILRRPFHSGNAEGYRPETLAPVDTLLLRLLGRRRHLRPTPTRPRSPAAVHLRPNAAWAAFRPPAAIPRLRTCQITNKCGHRCRSRLTSRVKIISALYLAPKTARFPRIPYRLNWPFTFRGSLVLSQGLR